jgi:hypothetical protein
LAKDKMYTSDDSILPFPPGAVCVCVCECVCVCARGYIHAKTKYFLGAAASPSLCTLLSVLFALSSSLCHLSSVAPFLHLPSSGTRTHMHVCVPTWYASIHAAYIHAVYIREHVTITYMRTGAANNIVNTQVDRRTGAATVPGRDGQKGKCVAERDNVNASTVSVDRPVCMKLEPTPGAATRAEMVLKRQGFLR